MRMQNVLYKLFVICIIKDLSEHKMVMHLIFFATKFQVQGNAINLSLKEFDGTHKTRFYLGEQIQIARTSYISTITFLISM